MVTILSAIQGLEQLLYPHGIDRANRYEDGRFREGVVLIQSPVIKRAAPLLVSSGSCLYAIVRARHLSLGEPSDATLLSFLLHQSDMILLLCGTPAIWYITQRRQHRRGLGVGTVVHGTAARAIHQLRQVFSALLLGTELLERRLGTADHKSLVELSQRLNAVTREGIAELAKLGEPYAPDLLD
jgi:hypothetical protein